MNHFPKIIYKILLSVFLFIFLYPQEAYPQRKIRDVVVFLGSNPNLPAYQLLSEGFRNTLSTDFDEPNNLMVEYLDFSRSNDEDHSFINMYKWLILIIFLFLVFETSLIVYLIRLYRRQKEINRHNEETERLSLELIRDDRLLRMAELTASLSHELSQPLTGILYNAQAGKRLIQSGKMESTHLTEVFDNIINDDKRAAGIIGSIKSLMKLESVAREKVDLNIVIRDAFKIFKSEAIKQNICLKLKLQKKPIYAIVDKIQIEQVFLNLLFNASNAMEKLGSEGKVIELSQIIEDGNVIFFVTDNGPGIEESVANNLFKSFVTTRKSGFGIGLTICQLIIERHEGKIMARNITDGGAEFSFSLKVSSDE